MQTNRSGMTLIELILAISIIAMMSTVVLVQHSRFRGESLITSIAYDAALAVREAQISSLGVREVAGTGFQVAYGVHYNTATPSSFFLFADVNGNDQWDPASDSLIKTFRLASGVTIAEFCAIGTPQNNCSASGLVAYRIGQLDILFMRPAPDAIILPYCDPSCTTAIQSATVALISPGGVLRTIVISNAGQISVQ